MEKEIEEYKPISSAYELSHNEYKNILVRIGEFNSRNLEDSLNNFESFINKLQKYDFVQNIKLDCMGMEFLNDFLERLISKDTGKLKIDSSKLILKNIQTNKENENYDKFENIEISLEQIKKIDKIKKMFPNLKNIKIDYLENNNYQNSIDISKLKISNTSKLFEIAEYMGVIPLDVEPNIYTYISKRPELNSRFLVSKDGSCIINPEKLSDVSKDIDLKINIEDLEKIDKEKIEGHNVVILIDDVSKLSIEQVKELQSRNLSIQGIEVFSQENHYIQNEIYDINAYVAIREKMDELVEDIDTDLPEKEKFAEIYKRVCSNIVYDVPAAYPITEEEKKYEKEQVSNSRNLKNGLLEGKCVCAGYADILRNALAMVGIESKYISGMVVDSRKKKESFKREEVKEGKSWQEKDDEVLIGEWHAWNKVKLDGLWYNVDSTWDATKVRLERVPTNCLKTDEEIKKKSKKDIFHGPDCTKEVTEKEIDKIFEGKHLYLGNFQIPNAKDVTGFLKELGEAYKELGRIIKRNFEKAIKPKADNLLNPSEDFEKSNNPPSIAAWDLERWGIDKADFSNETKEIVSGFKEASSKRDISERDVRE